MNYNEEMVKLFDKLGLEYKLEPINDKAKPEDFINIENKLFLKDVENNVLNKIPEESMPCLSLTLNKR